MQGWYSEYCEKTGQFCEQVKLKHSTKDRKTGSEIVYNVPSSSGYHQVPASPDNSDEDDQSNEDDINISYFYQQTTTPKPQPGKQKRRTNLMDKLKKMFVKLGGKYKKEKKKIALAPRDFLKKEKPIKTPENSDVDEEKEPSETFHNKEYDEFFDFVPMEYEAVEDVIIENY